MNKVTALRVAAFVVDLALVLCLVLAKRLFGVCGGKRARLGEDCILDQAGAAADAPSPAGVDLPDELKEEAPEQPPASRHPSS